MTPLLPPFHSGSLKSSRLLRRVASFFGSWKFALQRTPHTTRRSSRFSRAVQTACPRRSLRYSVLSCFPPRGPVSPLDWAITIHDPLYPPVPSSSWGPAPSSRVPLPLGPPQRSRPTHLPSGDTVLPSRVPSVLQGHLQGHPLLTNVLQDWRRQWHPTPVLLPGESHGWRSLEGCSPWSR